MSTPFLYFRHNLQKINCGFVDFEDENAAKDFSPHTLSFYVFRRVFEDHVVLPFAVGGDKVVKERVEVVGSQGVTLDDAGAGGGVENGARLAFAEGEADLLVGGVGIAAAYHVTVAEIAEISVRYVVLRVVLHDSLERSADGELLLSLGDAL